MNTNYGARPGLEHDSVHCACGNVVGVDGTRCVECAPQPNTGRWSLPADKCVNCAVELTDETRHDVHDEMCWNCGERKEQRIAESQEDRRVDRAQEREMFREWGGR